MRALLVAALGFLALSGCDQLGLGQHTAPAVAPPQAAVAPPEQMARLTPPVIHHHHHHVSRGTSQSWAEAEPESASYSSESRSYDEDSESSGDSQSSHEESWTDGYGREHYGAGVTRVAADDRKRLDPWHGYKSKCEDKERE